MEEDKKKQVLGNGLATESESPVVAKVQIRSCKPLRFWISFGTGDPEDVGQRYISPTQPANSENGSGVKKLGALVDYNDSDSDEGKLSC